MSNSVSPEVLVNRVNDMYKAGGFASKYASDILISTIKIIACLTLVTYFIADANMRSIKQNWKTERCKPLVMPLAGFINAPDDTDASEYTSQNFNFCISDMFSQVFNRVISVFYYMVSVTTNVFKGIIETVHKLRLFLVNLKNKVLNFIVETMYSIINFVVPFINLLIKMRDMMNKIEGVFLSIIYMLNGAYMALKSLFGSILVLCIIIIVVLLVIMIIMWVLVAVFSAVAFLVPFQPPVLAAAITFTVTTIIIVILFSIIAVFCSMVFQTNSSVPKVKNKKSQQKMDEHREDI
jgi:hypothetical protein